MANLVLSVETEELGIGAGLQDRVAQAYETPVFMNFDKDVMEKQGYGNYQTLDPNPFSTHFILPIEPISQKALRCFTTT